MGSLRPYCNFGVSPRATNFSLPSNQFNVNAFETPAGNFGTCPRNYGRGPGFIQPDLSVLKTTKIFDKAAWEFRAEMFNVVNHPNFANPGTSLIAGGAPGTIGSAQPGFLFGSSNSTIGSLIGIGTSRQIQLSSKITF